MSFTTQLIKLSDNQLYAMLFETSSMILYAFEMSSAVKSRFTVILKLENLNFKEFQMIFNNVFKKLNLI